LRTASCDGETPALQGWASSPGTILVAEDFAINRQLLQAQLKRLGLTAQGVADGREAVEAFSRDAFALVLMDCRMPVMDGLEATRAIRRLEAERGLKRTPIIATTAGATPEERERCLNAGMDDYLSKPVRLADLARVLPRWLPGGATYAAAGRGEGRPRSAVKGVSLPGLTAVDAGRLAGFLATIDEDLPFLCRLMTAFLEDMPGKMGSLRRALQEGDTEAMAVQAHGMKSSSSILGAVSFADLCGKLEGLVGAASVEGAEEVLAQIEEEYRRVAKDFQSVLAALSFPGQEGSGPSP
ncbi:MAG: response regulator, partial [Firmicutes bacterium]|nr:response regulator [Bacillota bacterium]